MLKKLATISLLVLFLFNFFGYRFIFNALQQHASAKLEAELDNNQYNSSELITLHVPLSMPYLSSSARFERVDGEITLNGKIYHYVERKVDNGELVLKCLPDKEKMTLESAKNNIAKASADASSNAEKKSGIAFKQVISDYDDALFQINISNSFVQPTEFAAHNPASLSQGFYCLPYQPPCV